jgi:hypothetical protein
MLKVGNRTSQIDHVVVSNYGIFVIETKNYKGWIIGNEFDDYWKQVIYKRKEKLRNPIKQNYGHVQALKEVLSNYPDIQYIPIVAFSNDCDLKIKVKSEVVYFSKLLKTISKYQTKGIDNKTKEDIYHLLVSLNVDSKENRKSHVSTIRKDIKVNESKVKNGVCPKCGGKLVERKGKYGKFKGCSNYPGCRYTA